MHGQEGARRESDDIIWLDCSRLALPPRPRSFPTVESTFPVAEPIFHATSSTEI
jgi:hypothetical protein